MIKTNHVAFSIIAVALILGFTSTAVTVRAADEKEIEQKRNGQDGCQVGQHADEQAQGNVA